MADDPDPPSRRSRLVARSKLALTLVAPIFALVALYFIAHASGSADQDNVANLATPTPPFASAPPTRTPEPQFNNPMFILASMSCPSPTPVLSLEPTPTPRQCNDHLEITFTNHWLS